MKKNNSLTNAYHWDQYWQTIHLPCEARRDSNEIVTNEILGIFDRYIPHDAGWSILEVGGAPGRFLAYLKRCFKCDVSSLDFSPIGSQLTRENFKILGLDIAVYEGDLFLPVKNLPSQSFDLVYSLGFIEHFQNLNGVISRQLDYVKPGGWLLIGVPHFIYTFAPIIRCFAPNTFRDHNLAVLNMKNWNLFEQPYHLQTIFKGYLGGLDFSSLLAVLEEEQVDFQGLKKTIRNALILLLRFGSRLRAGVHRIFPFWRHRKRINGFGWSAYAIGIYQKS